MPLTRRHFCAATAGAPILAAAESSAWSPAWDQALVSAAVAAQDAAYDPAEHLLTRTIGAEYHYHTNLRSRAAHPTRDSLDYALLLLEAGGEARTRRAHDIITRMVALQETDPATKWYGIWGYYMEEPAPKMSPADWNWADFNGSLLLIIEHRHGARLPAALRRQVREAIHHAAYSVRRRNVTMTYTNIAVQGTFVTLAAAELLGDQDLMGYATDRLRRFAATLDQTGSFAEFNSPTYANVTIANLTRIRMQVKDEASRQLADRIHGRAWLHLGKHWHAPSRQLAGPQSRAYRTDIGQPLWIQKALGGRLAFATLDDIRQRRAPASGETAILDYRCPDFAAPLFLEAGSPRQHRELFVPTIQGTTWLDRRFTIGSADRGNFWVQSRSLLGYWGEGGRTGGYLQMRFVKDDYDFASALLYSVQERNSILGLVNFRSPGGDKHPSLDPVTDGQFTAQRLRLRADLSGVPEKALRLVEGDSVAIDAGPVKIWLRFPGGVPLVAWEEEMMTVSLDLLRRPAPGTVRWADLARPYAVFHLAMEDTAEPLARFAARMRATAARAAGAGSWEWQSPAGKLSLTGGTAVAPIAEQDRAFRPQIDGQAVPVVRLSPRSVTESAQ
jgi:hypothetical protein